MEKWSNIRLVDCDKANFPLNVGKYGVSVECNQPQSSQIVRCPVLKKAHKYAFMSTDFLQSNGNNE